MNLWGWQSDRERDLLRAVAQLEARAERAEQRNEELQEQVGELLRLLAFEKAHRSEVEYLRTQVQTLLDRIAESADIANSRISAMLDRSSYGFVEGTRREQVIQEVLRESGRPPIQPPAPPDGVRQSPSPDLIDPVNYGEDAPSPLREGETRVNPPIEAQPEVPPPFLDDLLGQKMIEAYERGFIEESSSETRRSS
jgi:hypothetical protein